MEYKKALPRTSSLLTLTKFIRKFPATRTDIVAVAKDWFFSRDIVSFLKLFPESAIFKDTDDFVSRCEELVFFIKEYRTMPFEMYLSPQD